MTTLTQSLAAAQADYAQTKERAMEQLRDGKITLAQVRVIFGEAWAKRKAAEEAAFADVFWAVDEAEGT